MTRKFTIGSRGSELALWQANFVKEQLERSFPDREFEIRTIKTTGDEIVDTALSKIGDKGLFTKQIESQLLSGEIDLAAHSLKDLQTLQPDGLVIGAVLEREVPNDAFVSRAYTSIDGLPPGAKVATGSLRRRSQLLAYRPDLEIIEIRGNVPTRIRKYEEAELDALILAAAGLLRLGLEGKIREYIPFQTMLPAVGQGAVALEVRADDEEVCGMAAALDHHPTSVCAMAERAFLRRLEGGCQVPIGALATLENDRIHLDGMVGGLDGKIIFRNTIEGEAREAERLGTALAETLIADGAEELLAENRAQIAAAPGTTV